MDEVLNKYFASVFTKEKDLEDSKAIGENTNMLGLFETEKEVVLMVQKNIKMGLMGSIPD